MLHVHGMPEGVHVSFSPEDRLALSTAQPDPVFALIEAHRVAYAAWEPLAAIWNGILGGTPEYAAAEAAQEQPYRCEREAFGALLTVRPTTAAGLWALTAYLPEFIREAGIGEESHEQAALDALREGALRLGLASVQAEAGARRPEERIILDTRQIYGVRELVAIEAEQTAILEAGDYEDAFDAPDWVRLEGQRESILARVIATRAHTMEGLKAKASLMGVGSVKHSQEMVERLAHSIAADVAAFDVMSQPERHPVSPAVGHADPHFALLPALRQAFAWTREAYPFGDDPSTSPEGRAHDAVLNHCSGLSRRIVDLPPPTTLAGLGALALALSVYAEEIIGGPQNDGMDDQRYPEERRLVAATRAMMSVAGVSPLPGWVGFEVLPDSEARWEAVMEQAGEGSLPAWALAGNSGPDDEEIATGEEVADETGTGREPPAEAATADVQKAAGPVTAALELSACSVPQLARLYEVFQGTYEHISALGQLGCFWTEQRGFNPAGEIIDREVDRLGEMIDVCANEVARRRPAPGFERNDALCTRVAHEMRCNGRIHDPALMRDIATAWGA